MGEAEPEESFPNALETLNPLNRFSIGLASNKHTFAALVAIHMS